MKLLAEDLSLLRRFEPALRFTRGEQFFPARVEQYIKECSLWVKRSGKPAEKIAEENSLTLESLGRLGNAAPNSTCYLQFIEPLNVTEMAAYALEEGLKKKDRREGFWTGRGRLARVGYMSRLVDAFFSISLLARGRVPGDRAAAAALTYRRLMKEQPGHVYYGRVVRQSGWIVLQYWYFYVFNDWRSRYHGVNDHEADWEMVTIYLYEDSKGELIPEWVACASHDFSGDDLRRRWDDPEVEKIGEHPIIYAAAGSHACYFSAGEYLTEMEVPFLTPVARLVEKIRLAWNGLTRKPAGETKSTLNLFRVPFVDYARGDGESIGEGQAKAWDAAVLLQPEPGWVVNFRGLWGYYAGDPAAGEDAPAGPRYTRSGTVRRAWYDSVGWAGLDKVPTPAQAHELAWERREALGRECAALQKEIETKQQSLLDLGIESSAMRDQPHFRAVMEETRRRMSDLSAELNRVRASLAEKQSLMDALTVYLDSLQRGHREPVRAHIHRAIHREDASNLRLERLAEGWAAVSIGIALIAFIIILVFARRFLLVGIVVLMILMGLVESAFRRRLNHFIATITNMLALVCGVLLFYQFFWQIVIVLVVAAGVYMVGENLKELWR